MHKTMEQTIFYFGTPLALISTLNPDGSPSLAPMSSAWCLGWSCMLGLADGPDVEGVVPDFQPFGKNVNANVLEVHIVKPHVDENRLLGNDPPHIDPVRWRPLIMNFCRFFGLGKEVHPSRLAQSDFMKFETQGTMSQLDSSSSSQQRTVMPGYYRLTKWR
jgi:flavin reductase (DIM6/NTAB) family NADH-FMN oxidoreductase RutF